MSIALRVLLLIAAILATGWILLKIRRMEMKMQDAIFWVVFAGILLIMGIFPQISYWLSDKMGILSPANLIFLVVICLLLEKLFTLSIVVSNLEEKVDVLSAELALRSHDSKQRLDREEQILDELQMKLENEATETGSEESLREDPPGNRQPEAGG